MENCTPYVAEREQCKSCRFDTLGGINWESCPGPGLDAEGCRYYSPRPYPSDTVIYNEKAYTKGEKGCRTMSDLSMFNQQRELSKFSQQLLEERGERIGELLADLEAQNAEIERLRSERYRKCASMRLEAKRAIRQVLPGMGAPGMGEPE